MAAEEENTLPPDDRWSGFKDPNKGSSLGIKPKEDPGPDLSEYIRKVIEQRSPKKQHERMYKMASHLTRLITGLARSLTAEWKIYLQTNKKNEIESTELLTLTVDQYQCLVPLMRPLKPDAFKIIRKGLSSNQYYIKINSRLNKEEALLVRREWEPHIDKHGFLRADGIINWFNNGLSKACSFLLAESENIKALRCETLHDGTVAIHATISSRKGSTNDDQFNKDGSNVDTFSINIYPVFTLYSLDIPSDIRFRSPLPSSGRYIHVQRELKQAILGDLEIGKQIVFLESKNDKFSSHLQYSENQAFEESLCWRLNLNFTEYHVFNAMDKYCDEVDFRRVLVLMHIIREQFPSELGTLNDDILVSSMFIISQKLFSSLHTVHDWFLELVKFLIQSLNAGVLSSFYLARQNLLISYNITKSERKHAVGLLEDMLASLENDPENIYDFTGYIDKKKSKQDIDESEEDVISKDENAEAEESEEVYDKSNVAELSTC